MAEVTRGSNTVRVLLTAAAFVVVVAGMRAAEAIVVPFLLSIFIAIISAPPLFWLERKGLPRWLAMLVVIGVIIAAGVGLTALVGTSIREFSRDLPVYKTPDERAGRFRSSSGLAPGASASRPATSRAISSRARRSSSPPTCSTGSAACSATRS